MLTKQEIIQLIDKSYQNRITLIEMLIHSGVGHVGGALSAIFPTDGPYNEVLDYHGLTGPKIAERIYVFLSPA